MALNCRKDTAASDSLEQLGTLLQLPWILQKALLLHNHLEVRILDLTASQLCKWAEQALDGLCRDHVILSGLELQVGSTGLDTGSQSVIIHAIKTNSFDDTFVLDCSCKIQALICKLSTRLWEYSR